MSRMLGEVLTHETLSHRLARSLFLLRLNIKALSARTNHDEAIAHLGRVSINHTSFHDDALAAIRQSSAPLVRACLAQVVECHKLLHLHGDTSEIVTALRAIRNYIELIAGRLRPPFTNDDRLIVSILCGEACDLCALAIQNFAVKNIREIPTVRIWVVPW